MTAVHLLGTGGYHPSEARHTACIFFPELGLVLDAGTAFFRVRDLIATRRLDIFLTHAHLDHCQGLTYLLDVLHGKQMERVTLHGRKADLEAVTNVLFASPLFPLPFEYWLEPITGVVPVHTDWMLTSRAQPHPGGSLAYRLDGPNSSFAYVTDTTADPSNEASIEFVHGVDILLHECYFPDGFDAIARQSGHSTASSVALFAKLARVKQLVLIHANPLASADDLEKITAVVREIFPATILAHDKMIFDLP